MKQRLLNLLICLDQLALCILCLGNSYPDETISACAWRMEGRGNIFGVIFRNVIDWLFCPIEPHHCEMSFRSETLRSQVAPEER